MSEVPPVTLSFVIETPLVQPLDMTDTFYLWLGQSAPLLLCTFYLWCGSQVTRTQSSGAKTFSSSVVGLLAPLLLLLPLLLPLLSSLLTITYICTLSTSNSCRGRFHQTFTTQQYNTQPHCTQWHMRVVHVLPFLLNETLYCSFDSLFPALYLSLLSLSLLRPPASSCLSFSHCPFAILFLSLLFCCPLASRVRQMALVLFCLGPNSPLFLPSLSLLLTHPVN